MTKHITYKGTIWTGSRYIHLEVVGGSLAQARAYFNKHGELICAYTGGYNDYKELYRTPRLRNLT